MGLVDSLLNLHRVDSQVRGLRARLTQAERYLAAQDKQLSDLMRQHEELQKRRRQFQANVASSELELKTADARLEKLRNDLNGASTTKQHQAVLTEMNAVKAKRGQIEDRMLADMEQLEKLAEQFGTLETQAAERTRVRDLARSELDERKGDVGARLSELETERRQAAALLPEKILSLFDKLADDFDGEAMAPIEEIDRRNREYACGECHMHLPFEQFSQLSSSADVVVRCPSCTRILYVREESRVAPGRK
jgi:predicted  nucleic acid-binding Zn-ribbon protein